jgi:hypothetical protein
MVMTRILAALSLLLCVATAQAANIPEQVKSEIGSARLAGQGSYRWFGLKIYDAEFWVGYQGYRPDAPESAKFALKLTYARDLYGERIAQSSIDEISQLGFGTGAQREVWLKQMKALFPDVREGTQITGIYLPDRSARFYLGGTPLGEIAYTEFARAFFAIWLDPHTSAGSLRSQLLTSAE